MLLNTPKIMAVLNATPDSFYKGSRTDGVDDAIKRAGTMIAEGADILDVGAYSSRPGAEDISVSEELDRLIPIIQAIKRNYPDTPVSADTFRSAVAYEAIRAGADMVNDISGGDLDDDMFPQIGKLKVPYVLMHMRGTPLTMSTLTTYENIITEMLDYFAIRIAKLRLHGVTDILIDPGFGFAKTPAQSFLVLQNLHEFKILGLPVVAGLSRKSMIHKTLQIDADKALNGTTVLNTIALQKGAKILRVHDVREANECIRLFQEVFKQRP